MIKMFEQKTSLLCIAVLVSLALAVSQAKDTTTSTNNNAHQSLASKLMPQQSRARTSRSLSDMFEKVKSKIFGKKQQASSSSNQVNQQVQPSSASLSSSASMNSVQRQPTWGDVS